MCVETVSKIEKKKMKKKIVGTTSSLKSQENFLINVFKKSAYHLQAAFLVLQVFLMVFRTNGFFYWTLHDQWHLKWNEMTNSG